MVIKWRHLKLYQFILSCMSGTAETWPPHGVKLARMKVVGFLITGQLLF